MVTGDLSLDTESKEEESVGGKAILGKQTQVFLRAGPEVHGEQKELLGEGKATQLGRLSELNHREH